MSLADSRRFTLPLVKEPRGNLTFIESDRHVPFPIRRVYYLYDVPGGAERGGHAHKALHQLLIAVSGAFDVHLDDGVEQSTHRLDRAYEGLYIPPMTWRHIDNFSGGSVCLCLVSDYFDEEDYFRDYGHFVAALGG